MSKRVLLTILGVNPREACYALNNETFQARLAPVALYHLLPRDERPQIVIALCTMEARNGTLPELEAGLRSQNVTVRSAAIASGEQGFSDMDQFLSAMVAECEADPEATLTIDVTHGFRHFSFLMYAGALYLSALGRVKIARIYYALLARAPEVSPFFDLMPLLRLPQWIQAVRTLRETGSAKLIGELVAQNGIGREIKALMERLSDAHAAGLPIELGRQVDQYFTFRADPLRRSLRQDGVPLANRLADAIEAGIQPYRISDASRQNWKKRDLALDKKELERQARLVDELLQRRNLPAALGLMREWTVSWVLWNRRAAEWLNFRGVRRVADGQLGALAAAVGDAGLAGMLTQEQRHLADYWRALSELRNAFHHHGMRPQDLFGDQSEQALQRVMNYWQILRQAPRMDLEFGGRRHKRLLVNPMGERPGVLFSAVKCLSDEGRPPDYCLAVCSEQSEAYVQQALTQAGFQGQHHLLRLEDPYAGIAERRRIVSEARGELAVADQVCVNVTGGTTLMGIVVDDLAQEARRFARPVRRFALIDRRTPEEQKQNPFVLGDLLWLDQEES